jgi:hypothetical protein
MSDLLGVLQAPTGEKVKIVVAPSGAMPDERVVAFPTLTKNIIVAVNRELLIEAVERELDKRGEEEPDDDDINEAMMEFVPEIVLAATKIIDGAVNTNPFDLDDA